MTDITDTDRLNYIAENRILIRKVACHRSYFLVFKDGFSTYAESSFRKLIDEEMKKVNELNEGKGNE